MTWHATRKSMRNAKMQLPVDGKAWKNFDTRYSKFAKEKRNVRLGLAANGFSPFGNLSQSYSMWLIILTTYNLSSWLCMKEASFMLTLLIYSPKSPGKDIDVYPRPLIDDLIELWKPASVKTIDAVTDMEFKMRSILLWIINDFPARSSLFGWSGQGYMACPTCNKDTPSQDGHDVKYNNSSDLPLYASLNDLDFATLNIDSQSTEVKAPPDIILVDDDDDFIDDEDDIPHDFTDSDDEVLANADDDDD
ncbi:hypothetical protein Tco_0184550 [Tanacetum coccineum]